MVRHSTQKLRERGLSIIETVVYVALFSILSVVLVSSLMRITRAFNEFRIDRDINDSSIASMERITREIKNARSINLSGSSFATSSSKILLNTTDAVGTAMTVEFSVASGTLRVKENGVDKGALNSAKTTVDAFVLYLVNNSNSATVKIELFLSGQRGGAVKDAVFYNSAVMRDAY